MDEAYSLAEARLPWRDLLQVISDREVNGSAHTLLVAASQALLPGQQSARWLSGIFFLAAVSSMFVCLARRAGHWPAFVGTCVAVTNPATMVSAWTGRQYAMALLWGVLLFVATLRVDERGRPVDGLLWGLLASSGAYVHFFFIPVCIAYWLASFILYRPRRRILLRAFAVVGVGWTPILVFLGLGGDSGQLPDVTTPTLHDRLALEVDFLAGGWTCNRVGQSLVIILVLAVCLLGLRRWTDSRLPVLWLGLTGLVSLLAAMQLSAVVHPATLTSKYFPIGAMSLAAFISSLVRLMQGGSAKPHGREPSFKGRACSVGLGAVSVLGLVVWASSILSQPAPGPNSWTAAAETIERDGQPEDVMTTMVPFEEHAARAAATDVGVIFVPEEPDTASRFLAASSYADRDCLPTLDGDGSHLWVLSSQSPSLEESARVAAACAGLRLEERQQVGFVTILKFATTPASAVGEPGA